MRILLFDDDRILSVAPVETLTQMGFDVQAIHDWDEVCEVLNSNILPDLCFFDIEIEGHDGSGIDLAKMAITKSIPVILYSSYSNSGELAKRAEAAGIPLQFFIDRNIMQNDRVLLNLIENAYKYYYQEKPVSLAEMAINGSRKIGILPFKSNAGYEFISKDQVLYIESAPGQSQHALIHLKGHDRLDMIEVNGTVGHIAGQIGRLFYNIIKLDRTYYINVEQITGLEGATLFVGGLPINLSAAARTNLKKLHLLVTSQRD